ncbi:holo-ACP synthase [Buchnera aphidicola]|uniref:holo-ACP synthase n=1 Tax=Buchnera aphidicola TaxID=9 RepID=UPI002093B9F5|nr:holo-ACP synthase [Buchnera aphidicola]USS94299.1 holo-ACP synthase [Buchnera aphidicola (Sipha maydis)]WII23849.1 holo-ACP synthase [Buchnera aphidicola (Sipha maydis)]
MKIIGVGIDLLRIKRLKKISQIHEKKFLKKILTVKEKFHYYENTRKINFLAKSFVIKEAACKAIGIGMRKGISFKKIEVYNNKFNQPKIRFLKKIFINNILLKITKSYVSYTSEKKYVQAIVILK